MNYKFLLDLLLHDKYILLLSTIVSIIICFYAAHLYNPLISSPIDNLQFYAKDFTFTISCLSSTLACLILLPLSIRKRYLLAAVCIATELIVIIYNWHQYSLIWHLIYIGPFSYLICLITALTAAICYKNSCSQKCIICLEVLGLSMAMPTFYSIHNFSVTDPTIYDLMLMKADNIFNSQPSFIISGLLRSNNILLVFLRIVYVYLPLWMMLPQIIVFKAETYGEDKSKMCSPGIPAITYIAVAVFGTICYHYYPAIGPMQLFGSIFPYGIYPDITADNIHVIIDPVYNNAPRNCMPSLHLTWILCALFSIYGYSTLCKTIWQFLSVCTLGSAFCVGGHWANDFLVALPFTAFCLSLTWHRIKDVKRYVAVGCWGLITFGMMLVLKHFVVNIAAYINLYWALAVTVDIAALLHIKYMIKIFNAKTD